MSCACLYIYMHVLYLNLMYKPVSVYIYIAWCYMLLLGAILDSSCPGCCQATMLGCLAIRNSLSSWNARNWVNCLRMLWIQWSLPWMSAEQTNFYVTINVTSKYIMNIMSWWIMSWLILKTNQSSFTRRCSHLGPHGESLGPRPQRP